MRQNKLIPICQRCGVACSVCARKFGEGPGRCCLIVAGKPE